MRHLRFSICLICTGTMAAHHLAYIKDYTNKLKESLTCSMCLEIFNHADKVPKALPCGHSFCLDCLQQYVQTQTSNKLKCPLCNNITKIPNEGVKALPTNVALKNTIDSLPEDDVDTEGLLCPEHPENECTFVCMDCRVGLCQKCITSRKPWC